MKRIELKSLHLRNFAGARDVQIDLDGQDTRIYGANAVGKTTVFSGFTYLLFEKNSLGASTFDIKTIDAATGQPLSGVHHEVEGVLSIDGREVTLKRVYKEVWKTPRGSADQVFGGHETLHFIDGVPETKGAFSKRIAEIADEATWRLLSDPQAFQALHWQDRRRVLLEVCGDVTDAEVISRDKSLAELQDVLSHRGIDDHRKVLTAKRTELNREIQQLPVRIDEVTKGLADLTPLALAAIQKKLAPVEKARAELADRISSLKAGTADGLTERRKLAEVEDQLTRLERDAQRAYSDAVTAAQDRHAAAVREAQSKATQARHVHAGRVQEAAHGPAAIEQAREWITQADERLEALRAEWVEVNSRKVDPHTDDTCSACKQSLPADQVEAAHVAAVEQLNAKKAQELERIQSDAAKAKERRAELDTVLAEREQHHAAAADEIAQLDAIAVAAEQAAREIKGAQPESVEQVDVTSTPAYTALAVERDDLARQIASLETGDDTAVTALQAELAELDESIHDYRVLIAQAEQRNAGEKRITELKGQERMLAQEFEDVERQLFLLDEFTRTKVALLEDRINSRFEFVRFRLFKTLVSGGLEEVCDTTIDSVPYDSLNSAAKVQAGMDIIRTLQQHYGLQAPCWIDGRESVTTLPEMDSQVISLIVSPEDKQLRIELEAQKEAVA